MSVWHGPPNQFIPSPGFPLPVVPWYVIEHRLDLADEFVASGLLTKEQGDALKLAAFRRMYGATP